MCLKSLADLPAICASMFCAARRPICLVGWLTLGTGLPSMVSAAMSPMTEISGCCGNVRLGCTFTRPARSSSSLNAFPSGDPATPAAHIVVRALIDSSG